MRVGRSVRLGIFLVCCVAWSVHAGSKQDCKAYLGEHVPAIGVLPEVTGLDGFVADPDNAALRVTTENMLGYQETESLRALMAKITAAWENREDCVGDVGKKIKIDQTPIDPREFVAYVEALHDHGLPLLEDVLDARVADKREAEERRRIESELGALLETWSDVVPDLAAKRDVGETDPDAVAKLRGAVAEAETDVGRCLAHAYLLRAHPPDDAFAERVRAFEPCLDLPEGSDAGYGDFIREQGFLGAVEGRNLMLRSDAHDRAIRTWSAVLDAFGGELGGDWSEPVDDGLPEDLAKMAAPAADLGWPARSRIELGLYCLSQGDLACVDRWFAGGDDGLDVSESLLATVADRLGEAGNPLAVDLWEFLAEHGTQRARYVESRVRFQVERGMGAEVRGEVAALITAGDCARAARLLSMVSASTGSDPLADVETLMPCTEQADEEARRAAWEAIGNAYRGALGELVQSDPPRMAEAVALARKALAIPAAYRGQSVTDYARYVVELSERQSTAVVDEARARLDRFDGCTETLSTIEWKRRKEDASFTLDLRSLRLHCCSFLRDNLDDWVDWMESDPETTDSRGRTVRRQFTAEEIENKQGALRQYCRDR